MTTELSQHHWWYVIWALIGLACMTIFLAGWNVTLVQHIHRQDARVAATEARLEAAGILRQSEARSAKARSALECRVTISYTELANEVIRNIRKTVIDLSNAVVTTEVSRTLRSDAQLFREFETPRCSPGG